MTSERRFPKLAACLWTNRHLRAIAIIMVVCSMFYHLPFFASLVGWTSLQEALGRLHEFYGLVFFAPVVYAAYVFGIKGAALTAFAAILVILPYAASADPYVESLLRATAFGIILSAIGAAVALIQKGDDKYRDRLDELRHLHDIGRLADTSDSLDEFLSSVVQVIPNAIACPELRVSIEVGDRVSQTADFARANLESVITIPLRAKDIVPGVLKVGCSRSYRFSAQELDLLESIADQVAISIANAELHEGTRQNLERLALIGETSRIMASSYESNELYRAFTSSIAELIHFDEASVHLVEDSGQRMRVVPLPPSEPAGSEAGSTFDVTATGTEWVIRTRKPHIESDLLKEACFASDKHLIARGFRSTIRLPLIAKGKVFGTFNLRSASAGTYSWQDVGLLEHLVGQLAVAIENAALFSCIHTQEKQLEQTYGALEAAQDYMALSEGRMKLLAEMAANMVGDFNNVLSSMMSRVRQAMEDTQDSRVQEGLEIVERSALDAVNAIRRLHDTTRKQLPAEKTTESANDLVRDAIQMEKLRRLEHGDAGSDGFDIALACRKESPTRESEVEIRKAVMNILIGAMNGTSQSADFGESVAEEPGLAAIGEDEVSAVQPIAIADLKGNLIYTNASFLRLWGYGTENEVLGRPIEEFWHFDHAEPARESFPKAAAWQAESTATRRDGSTFDVQVNATMVTEVGKLICMRATFADITKRKQAERDIRGSFERLRKALEETISVLTSTMERNHPRIALHQQRVARLASAMAREMELPDQQTYEVSLAASLHDIGKIDLPPEVLDEPGWLGDLETAAVLKTHPQLGYDMVRMLPFNGHVAQIILQHHELYDGSGYPSGLSGEDILMGARILAVANAMENLMSEQSHQFDEGLTGALEKIAHERGNRYDPHAVDTCLRLFVEKGFTFERTQTDGSDEPCL